MDKKARSDLTTANCTLEYWDRRLAEHVARQLLSGAQITDDELARIRAARTYWQGEIERLNEYFASRPPGWGDW